MKKGRVKQEYIDSVFQAIFDQPSIGASILGEDGKFLRANKKLCQMLGYDESELIGKTPFEITHPEDQDKTSSFHKNLNTVGPNGDYEKRYVRKDGSTLWVRVIAKLIRHPTNPNLFLTVALNEDISAKKAVLDMAEFGQIQLKAILDTSLLGIWCIDSQLKITFTNPAFQKMLGYTEEQLLKMNVKDLTHPEDFIETKTTFTQVQPGESYIAYRRYLKSDGTYIPTRINVKKFAKYDPDKRLYACAITEDISAQKAAEELIRQQQEKLISSAKMAALGEMAGGISHEINNPLSVIIGKVGHVVRRIELPEVDKDKIKSDLQIISDTAHRIASIVRGLRTISRQADNDPWVDSPLSSIIEESVSLCGERFKTNGIALTVKTIPNISVQCRPAQLVQVLVNLLSNAVDAIIDLPTKWVSLEMQIVGNNIQILITDSGNGIPADVAKKIMQPFFTTKEVGKGTGLGLSISSGIAQSHKGSLTVDMNHKNTRFVLELPMTSQSTQKPA